MQSHAKHSKAATTHAAHYRHLFIMLALSALAMYGFMYGMVDRFGNVYTNLNQLYMVLVMVAPMAMIELIVMRSMYPERRLNAAIMIGSAIVLLAAWIMLRQQTAIGDRQFLRSMIPHHAGAILMCEQAPITNAEIQALCRSIIRSQQTEIDQMKRMLTSVQ